MKLAQSSTTLTITCPGNPTACAPPEIAAITGASFVGVQPDTMPISVIAPLNSVDGATTPDGSTTNTRATVRVVPSEKDSVSAPRYTLGARLSMFGWITMRTGCAAVTMPSSGVAWHHFPPSVTHAAWNVTGVVLRLCTVTFCDPGDCAPAVALKISAEGCTSGPTLLPGASTFRNTETNCGLLSAPGAVTCTVPE